MITVKKFHNKNIICIQTIRRIDKDFITKKQISKYQHFILRPYQDKKEQAKLESKLKEQRHLSIGFFQLQDLIYVFNLMIEKESLIEISKLTNFHIKTIKENLFTATEQRSYGARITCSNCNHIITNIHYLSMHEFAINKINVFQNIYDGHWIKREKRLKPVEDFIVNWNHKRIKFKQLLRNNRNIDLGENIKYIGKVSDSRLLDEYIKENEGKNVFIPTLQTFYNAIENCLDRIDHTMFVSKRGIKDSMFNKNYKKKKKKIAKRKIPGSKSIHFRDENINNRSEFGHYEFDTVVFNKSSKLILVTLYERKSRLGYAMLSKRDSKSVAKTLAKMVVLYKLNIKSLTIDNGFENYLLYTVLGENVIFNCDPYSSWQKGGIECWHKEIRKYIPKGKFFSFIDNNFIFRLCEAINNSKRNYYLPNRKYPVRLSPNEYYNLYS
ncbi:IS30 family transposase [Mycoplasmopsis verecunda]|uniref:Transposase n=1 Tax=Mycoplasmopsis verecunda TaxID=171291 RepID=A0A1T4LDA4_9BACT|nr:IS30 family transposase [Mycoplasmopsis verecunda]WPB54317.1 IS30 family transposase [Mycoplasmopsis verecunda]SJZ52660.1 hypothetical protein SAMN02745154_00412 [Mycoplasmopsis verecunda]